MDAQELLKQKLSQLWLDKRPLLMERIDVIQTALNTSKNLTTKQQEAARSAAHNLAGVLGTFGLKEGTEIARQFEAAFTENPVSIGPEHQTQIDKLRNLIESHQP
jgi:HPt (histidine-containing phosphotransfer) domain-containing protein